MCRLLILKATGRDWSLEQARALLDGFRNATLNDPLLGELTRGDGRHCHGIGYALYTPGLEAHKRYDAADLYGPGEDSCKENLGMLNEIISELKDLLAVIRDRGLLFSLLLHSRRASRGSPRGSLMAHPYPVSFNYEGASGILYFAHNGSIDHRDLALRYGLDPELVSDSYVVAYHLAKSIGEGIDPQRVLWDVARRYLKRALVTGTLLLYNNRVQLVYSSILSQDLDEERRRYYTPFHVRGRGLVGLVSPTVWEKLTRGSGLMARVSSGVVGFL